MLALLILTASPALAKPVTFYLGSGGYYTVQLPGTVQSNSVTVDITAEFPVQVDSAKAVVTLLPSGETVSIPLYYNGVSWTGTCKIYGARGTTAIKIKICGTYQAPWLVGYINYNTYVVLYQTAYTGPSSAVVTVKASIK